MSNPAFVWNGNTLAFPYPASGYEQGDRSHRSLSFSHGRAAVTQVWSRYDEPRVVLVNFDDLEFAASLRAWWAWAVQGKAYAFALDAADVVNKTLSGAAAAGQKDIPIAVTAGAVVGAKYRIRKASGLESEVVHVASVTTDVKVVARDNLMFSYLTSDVFRSRDYYPAVVSLDDTLGLVENPGLTWTFDHRMGEDRG